MRASITHAALVAGGSFAYLQAGSMMTRNGSINVAALVLAFVGYLLIRLAVELLPKSSEVTR